MQACRRVFLNVCVCVCAISAAALKPFGERERERVRQKDDREGEQGGARRGRGEMRPDQKKKTTVRPSEREKRRQGGRGMG